MRAVFFGLAWLLAALPAVAQPLVPPCKPTPSTYQDLWCARVDEIVKARTLTPTGPLVKVRETIENASEIHSRNWRAFLLYAQARSEALDQGPVEDARTDKQLGAPANAWRSASATVWPDASSAASASSSIPPGKWWYSDPLETPLSASRRPRLRAAAT